MSKRTFNNVIAALITIAILSVILVISAKAQTPGVTTPKCFSSSGHFQLKPSLPETFILDIKSDDSSAFKVCIQDEVLTPTNPNDYSKGSKKIKEIYHCRFRNRRSGWAHFVQSR